jgi:hypothetical protein
MIKANIGLSRVLIDADHDPATTGDRPAGLLDETIW